MIGFELLSQALIQPTQAMFRRSVRGRVSRAGNAGHGCDVDKNPLPATLKFPHRHPGAVDCTKQIRSYNLFMFCNGGICETAKRSHPGVIDPDINPSEMRSGSLSQLLDLFAEAHVRLYGQSSRTVLFALSR